MDVVILGFPNTRHARSWITCRLRPPQKINPHHNSRRWQHRNLLPFQMHPTTMNPPFIDFPKPCPWEFAPLSDALHTLNGCERAFVAVCTNGWQHHPPSRYHPEAHIPAPNPHAHNQLRILHHMKKKNLPKILDVTKVGLQQRHTCSCRNCHILAQRFRGRSRGKIRGGNACPPCHCAQIPISPCFLRSLLRPLFSYLG